MEGMSEREYSAHSGLSRGAIQKARKAGRLAVYSDGSINAAASEVDVLVIPTNEEAVIAQATRTLTGD